MPRDRLTLYPSIDLRANRVVRLQQGDYGRQIDYDVAPIDVARQYADAGARWLHVVDLDGAKAGQFVHLETIAELAGSGLKVQAGGGVRSTGDVRRLLDAGCTRAVVGTQAVRDPEWFAALLAEDGMPPRLTLALDGKSGKVAAAAWQETTDQTVLDLAKQYAGSNLGAILYTDVARDGMLQGPDLDGTIELAQATDIPVIASGGVGTLDHVHGFAHTPVHGLIIGRALFDGRFTLSQALAATT
jgi:phosphoribosylformimino-5-aminoimidazole carboxamide ribotide isomerase